MVTLNLFLILGAALVNLATAYMVIQLRKVVVDAAANILKVELATNSMKDALVAATAKASLIEGQVLGRAEEKKDRIEHDDAPVPVTDNRVAQATEKMAAATEKMADAAEIMTKKEGEGK